MTACYHGTPITPQSVLETLHGYYFCVSYLRDENLRRVHEIGAGVMLDNGAFSAWTQKCPIEDWRGFYAWCEPWLSPTTWAVIPDVILDDDAANDALLEQWPHGDRGAPVWHMHESIDRLLRLAGRWPRVCIGSSQEFKNPGSRHWHNRMVEAMNALCGDGPPPCALHMMRGLQFAGSIFPFASVDSTNIARNHKRPQNSAIKLATLWNTQHCPIIWRRRPTLRPLILPLLPRQDGRILD